MRKAHGKTHHQHKNDIILDINLKSKRADLKPLLAELKPALRKLVKALEKCPDPDTGCESPGYHNINYTQCREPEK